MARVVGMLRTAAILAMLMMAGGCEHVNEREIVIADSTLIDVLADLHLADARARLPGAPVGLRDSVLHRHGLDEAEFQRAMDGFIDYPEDLVNLYNSVLDRLNASRTP